MKRVWTFCDEHLEKVFLCVLLSAIALVMLTDIVLRLLRVPSISWAVEFCQYCFVYTAFISIPYCIKKGTALNIDIFVNFLPVKAKKSVALLTAFISLALWSYFCHHAWFVLADSVTHLQTSTTMGFPMYWIYGMPAFAFAAAVLRQAQQIFSLIQDTRKRSSGLPCPSEVQ
jgi:TRAP-type C4-dicarboxylate transport system permease small subunit